MVLTDSEFDIVYNKALKSFATAAKKEMISDVYRLRSYLRDDVRRLWLYAYALNSWDNTPGAVNYLTEEQMLRIVSKVQQNGI